MNTFTLANGTRITNGIVCEHGVGHVAPEWALVHACDGCCINYYKEEA